MRQHRVAAWGAEKWEWKMGGGKWGVVNGSGNWEVGNWKWEMGSGKWEVGNGRKKRMAPTSDAILFVLS